MEAKLRAILYRATLDGHGIKTIKQEIRNAVDISSSRAEMIARTEMNRAANAGRLSAYKEAGVSKVRWVTVQDVRTSNICRTLDGTVSNVGDPFTAVVDGKRVQVMSPPAHPNCRSTIVSVD